MQATLSKAPEGQDAGSDRQPEDANAVFRRCSCQTGIFIFGNLIIFVEQGRLFYRELSGEKIIQLAPPANWFDGMDGGAK